jgi:hypothetical protein
MTEDSRIRVVETQLQISWESAGLLHGKILDWETVLACVFSFFLWGRAQLDKKVDLVRQLGFL